MEFWGRNRRLTEKGVSDTLDFEIEMHFVAQIHHHHHHGHEPRALRCA